MKIKTLLFVSVIIIGFTITALAQIPTNGLIAYYPFTGNAMDLSNNGNNGTVNGATLTTDRFGNLNSAYSFNGIDNYISVPNSTSLQSPTDQFTLSAWVNVDNLSARHWVLDKRRNLSSSPYTSYALFASTNTSSQTWNTSITTSTNSTGIATSSTAATIINTWYHLVSIYDGSKLYLYVNGVLESQVNVTGNIGYSSLPLYIGTNMSDYIKGKIDDIRIYNRALTTIEIAALYNENLCYQTVTVTDTLVINTNITSFNPLTYSNVIKVYPNPTNDHLTIDNGNFPSLAGYTIKITNSLGQTMFTSLINQQQLSVDLSTWTGNGLYFVHIINPQSNIVDIKKIVLQ